MATPISSLSSDQVHKWTTFFIAVLLVALFALTISVSYLRNIQAEREHALQAKANEYHEKWDCFAKQEHGKRTAQAIAKCEKQIAEREN